MKPQLLVAIVIACCIPALCIEPATAKADAKYYLFGSALFGVGTKPLYSADLKVDWSGDFGGNRFWGVAAVFIANANAEPPIDKPDIDPDSVSGAITFRTSRKFGMTNLHLELEPLKGEFVRKHPLSNLLTAGGVRASWKPWGLGPRRFVLYPSLGLEAGSNLNRPRMLFKRPVDLDSYRSIGRLRGGGAAAWYLLANPPTPDRVFTFVIDASWVTRVLFTDEPFVRSEYLPNDKGEIVRQKVTRLRRNARHQTEVGFSWHVSPLAAIRTQYRRGALPPLFEFVDHQVTLGLVFKGR